MMLILLVLNSCNTIEDEIQGEWVFDQAYYNNEPVFWDLCSNGASLKEDGTCDLPTVNCDDRNTNKAKGVWEVIEKDSIVILNIKTNNEIFNRNFKVSKLGKVYYPKKRACLIKMTLLSDSLKLECTKIAYCQP